MKITTAIVIGLASEIAANYDKDRSSLIIYNNSASAVIYYGSDNTLSTSNGFPIPPKTGLAFSEQTGDDPSLAYWLVSDTAGTDVRVGEGRAVQPVRAEGV
ncbi:MAG: hypothetical protein PHQ41_04040 [Candidatus Cloacimonetes bacterium]|nr:hypothetical protein [Candidatus Cloacimonadota bacterium]